SYDQLGKLFSRGLARYLLLTASKRTDLPTSELEALNRAALEAPVPFSEASLSAGRYEVEWLEKETAARRLAPGRWLIVPGRQGVAPALKARLEAVGERASLLAANGGARAVLEELDRALEDPFRGLVYLRALDAPGNDHLDLGGLRATESLLAADLLPVVQALGARPPAGTPRLWIVTRDAQPAAGQDPELAPSLFLGFARTPWLEHPSLQGGLVDVNAGRPEEIAASIEDALRAPTDDSEAAYRSLRRLVPRLRRRTRPASTPLRLRPDATYLVTGGLGALGRRAAAFLVE